MGLYDGHTISTLNESMLPTQGWVQPDDLTTQGSLVDWMPVSVRQAQAPSSTRTISVGLNGWSEIEKHPLFRGLGTLARLITCLLWTILRGTPFT